MTQSPPEGFRPLKITEGYVPHNGPYYFRRNPEGRVEFGFQSDERHVNPNGVLHGGAILGFLDTVLGHCVVYETRRRCATVSFDTQFLAAARPGAWITGRVRVKRVTRTLAFVDGEALAGDTVLVSATSVFRVFEGEGAAAGTSAPRT